MFEIQKVTPPSSVEVGDASSSLDLPRLGSLLARLPRLRPESERLLHLDALRLIASAMVIFHHFKSELCVSEAVTSLFSRTENFRMAVDLFFVISGFVISFFYAGSVSNVRQCLEFFRKRLARLLPLHWLTASVFMVAALGVAVGVVSTNHDDQFALSCVVPNLLLLNSVSTCGALSLNYVSWSISAEIFMYLLFPVLITLASPRPRVFIAISGTVFIFYVLAFSYLVRPWTEWTYDYGAARAIPSFMIGISLYLSRSALKRIPAAGVLMWLALAALVSFMYIGSPRVVLLLLIYVIVALAVAADEVGRVGGAVRRLAPLGTLTYSMYMIHPVIELTMITVLGKKVLQLEGLAMNVWILMAVFVVAILSYLSFFFFETPVRRWAVGQGARKPKPV